MQRPRPASNAHFRHSHIPELICGVNSSIDLAKYLDTRSQEVIDECLGMFNCLPAQQVIATRKRKFLKKISAAICADNAVKERRLLCRSLV